MKVIFMGTPYMAVPVLQSLFNSSHEIVQVYTKPPAKSGRGHRVNISPIHELANKLNLPVSCPNTLKTDDVAEQLSSLKADIIVVVAYGHILPKQILNLCKYGCINIHPSLLPRWRGAAPVERTILAGDTETAVCIMKMDVGLDTGDVLLQQKVNLDNQITSEELYEKLASIGAELLIKVLDNFEELIPIVQSEEGVTYAKKLSKEESIIDWHQSAEQINRMIRGLNPWPGCFFKYKGETIKVLKAKIINDVINSKLKIGEVIDDRLSVNCGQGVLQLLRLQRPGRNPLDLSDFLRGNKIMPSEVLE
jgi:methionyl-tRNA formyltransferase